MKRTLEDRSFRITVTLLLIFVAFIFLNNLLFKASSERFCSSCHIMKPSVASHSASKHSRTSCFSCHFRSSFFLADALRYLSIYRCFYSELTDRYEKPLNLDGSLSQKIRERTCLQCHIVEKKISPRLGIKINHEVHHEKKIECTRCHNRAAHDLKTTERLMVELKIASTVPYDDRTKMKFCMECHTGLLGQPTSDCEACHTQEFKLPYNCVACHAEDLAEIIPKDHNQKGFEGAVHAKEALKNLNYCLQCHTREYCAECHAKNKIAFALPEKTKVKYHPPRSHFEKNFMPPLHGDEAVQRGKDYCYQCHKPNFCDDCHRGVEMPHPADFKEKHGKIVKESGFEEKCSFCHKNRDLFCNAGCHHVGWKPEMGPMVKSHPRVVEITGVTKCYDCHTSVYCAVCHVSGKTKRQFKN